MNEYNYDFSSPTPFLKYKANGKTGVINKNNIISIKELEYYNNKTGDFVEVLVDKKYGTMPLSLVFDGKLDNLKEFFEPFYL